MKNKKILMIISIITLISFVIGFSYAYFTTIVIGNDTASSNITTSGSLKLNFNGVDYIDMQNSIPGDTDSMTFTVTNSGTLPINSYEIFLSKLTNTFINNEVVYEIECVSSDAISCSGKIETPVQTIESLSITQTAIASETTHTYTLTVTFIDTGLPQDYNQEKELSFTISIDEMIYLEASIAKKTGWNDLRYFWDYKNEITEITFENSLNIPVGAFESWDVTEEQNGKIMAYIIDDGLGMNTYELFIQSNQTIYANQISSGLFYYFNNTTIINNISLLNTSLVTNMSSMFSICSSLTSLNLSSFDTSNVIYMSSMFGGCWNLTILDLSSFDTSLVNNMNYLFSNCSSLTSLNLSVFDTLNVIYMSHMFYNCGSLVTLDLSTFDTSSVIDMSYTFLNCNSLTSLNLSGFDTLYLTNMSYMFNNTANLQTLRFDEAIFTYVTSYDCMFANSNTSMSITVNDSTSYSWITNQLTNGYCPPPPT